MRDFANPSQVSLTYPGQLFDVSSERDAETRVVAFHPRRAEVLHSGGTSLWFAIRLLPLFRIAVVPVLTCVLWRKGERAPGRAQRLSRNWLDG